MKKQKNGIHNQEKEISLKKQIQKWSNTDKMMVSNSLYKCVSMCLNENIMINNLNREIKKQMETLELKYERWQIKNWMGLTVEQIL